MGSRRCHSKVCFWVQGLFWADHVVLDYRMALDYLFAEQRGACAIVNTSCFTWINTSGIAETQIQEITNKPLAKTG